MNAFVAEERILTAPWGLEGFRASVVSGAPDFAGCYYADRGSNRWGKRTEEGMRELHCMCGNHVVADNDERLVYQVLEHAREVHPEMDLTEEQAREMVAAGAYDRGDASDTEDTSH